MSATVSCSRIRHTQTRSGGTSFRVCGARAPPPGMTKVGIAALPHRGLFAAASRAFIAPDAPLTSLRSIRPLVALSSYSSAQTPQWKSATGELAAKAVRGSPVEGCER